MLFKKNREGTLEKTGKQNRKEAGADRRGQDRGPGITKTRHWTWRGSEPQR